MLSSLLKRTKSKGVILRALCTLSVFFVVMIVLVSCGGFQPYISTTTQEGENIPAFEDLTETITDAVREIMTVVSTDSKLAVTEFEKGSKEILDELMEIVENEVVDVPIKSSEVMVLDRETVSFILEERKMQLFGLAEAENTAELGEILGATHLLFGKLTPLGNDFYVLYLRVVEVSSARIVVSTGKRFHWSGTTAVPKKFEIGESKTKEPPYSRGESSTNGERRRVLSFIKAISRRKTFSGSPFL